MPEISSASFSETDASNNAASPNGFIEGMAFSGVNDSARAVMGAVKRFWGRIQGINASTGSANAYVLTPTVALAAYVTGERYSFRANFANTAAATLAISGLAARTIKKMSASGKADLAANDIVTLSPVTVEADATDLILCTPVGNASTAPTVQVFTVNGTYTKPAGLKSAWIRVQGPGGGGAGCAASEGAAGGGAGGCSLELVAAATIGATETVTVPTGGAGGAAGANAGTGGTTASFGTIATATGGTGASGTGGAGDGGAGTGGDANLSGGAGQGKSVTVDAVGGMGGTAHLGGGGRGGASSAGGGGGNFGGGGGGGGGGGAVARAGGNGGAGVVIVVEYY